MEIVVCMYVCVCLQIADIDVCAYVFVSVCVSMHACISECVCVLTNYCLHNLTTYFQDNLTKATFLTDVILYCDNFLVPSLRSWMNGVINYLSIFKSDASSFSQVLQFYPV